MAPAGTQRDPLVEEALRLGKALDFRQPGEGGTATTRAQVTRHLRAHNRDAVAALVATFRPRDDAVRLRATASAARATEARTAKEVSNYNVLQAALRRAETQRTRLKEQEQAQDQLTAQVKSQLGAALEDQARLTRVQQEQQEQRERATCLSQLQHRGRRLRPLLESFAQHQKQQIQAVRSRMLGDADPTSDAVTLERIGQLCGQVQQELWQQLNAASMAAASGSVAPGSLLLTAVGQEQSDDPFAAAMSALGPGCAPGPDLEAHLHLPRASPLQRQVAGLLLLPPRKLVAAVGQLSKTTHNGLVALMGGWDLLADARHRCQALGTAVDPLFDVRKLQQAQLDSALSVRLLRGEVRAAKVRALELAATPAVQQALTKPGVLARVQVESRRVAVSAARGALAGLHRDAETQGQLLEEVARLEAAAFDMEREDRRLESLVNVLAGSLGHVVDEWQQQYPANQEFLRRMLPKAYGDVIDSAGRSTDRLSRGVAELMRVPQELLPALVEQRRAAGAARGVPQGLGGQAAAAGGGGGVALAAVCGSSGAPPPISSLCLVERMRLALPYVGPRRAAVTLRAAAAQPTYMGSSASTHGSLLLRGSVASSQGDGSDGGLLGMGSGGGGFGTSTATAWPGSAGEGASSGAAAGPSWAGAGPGHGMGLGEDQVGGWAARGSSSVASHGSGPGYGMASGAGVGPAAVVSWGPGPAALGLPVLCYWLSVAAALDPLAPLRCPAALLRDMYEGFRRHEGVARWLGAADTQLRSRHRELASLRPSAAALRQRLGAKRQADAAERLARLARSRSDMLATVELCAPRVRRAMREMEEQGAVRLVPWRRVNGQTAAEVLDEIRSLFARIHQLQQQPHPPPHQLGFGIMAMPPPPMGF